MTYPSCTRLPIYNSEKPYSHFAPLSTEDMATTSKVAPAALLLLLIAAAALVPASASTLTAFSAKGCAGKTKDVNGCGCFKIQGYQGGYHFVFTQKQNATLYTGLNCDGLFVRLSTETRRCEGNNFNSIFMHC